jgi:hypothetical protein
MFLDVGHEGQNILNYSSNLISFWISNFAYSYTNLPTSLSLSFSLRWLYFTQQTTFVNLHTNFHFLPLCTFYSTRMFSTLSHREPQVTNHTSEVMSICSDAPSVIAVKRSPSYFFTFHGTTIFANGSHILLRFYIVTWRLKFVIIDAHC